jgi:hypothetical protein
MLALFGFGFVAFLLTSLLAFVLASFLASGAFDGGFSLAAVLGAVVGATLAVGGFALFAAHALVCASAVHSAMVLALLGSGDACGGVLGGLCILVAVAGNHGEHGHSGHSGKQNFLHFVLMFWLIKYFE